MPNVTGIVKRWYPEGDSGLVSCDDKSRRRLGAAALEEEEVLALDEAGFLSSYLKEHPALAAMVDDELHALLLEVLADSKG